MSETPELIIFLVIDERHALGLHVWTKIPLKIWKNRKEEEKYAYYHAIDTVNTWWYWYSYCLSLKGSIYRAIRFIISWSAAKFIIALVTTFAQCGDLPWISNKSTSMPFLRIVISGGTDITTLTSLASISTRIPKVINLFDSYDPMATTSTSLLRLIFRDESRSFRLRTVWVDYLSKSIYEIPSRQRRV